MIHLCGSLNGRESEKLTGKGLAVWSAVWSLSFPAVPMSKNRRTPKVLNDNCAKEWRHGWNSMVGGRILTWLRVEGSNMGSSPSGEST